MISSIHPFVQFTIVVWVCAAIATAFSKDSSCMGAAFAITLLAGFGYLMHVNGRMH